MITKRHNSYALITVILFIVGCIEIPKDTRMARTVNGRYGCDLIWEVRQRNQREIFFRNTCKSQPCMVMWRSKNILGMRSPLRYEQIPPQGELSYPISFYNIDFDVDYYFQ